MNATKLSIALRLKADALSNEPTLRAEHQDVPELIRALARILEGQTVERAFGAPGDWGYGTPIGAGILAMLQEPFSQKLRRTR